MFCAAYKTVYEQIQNPANGYTAVSGDSLKTPDQVQLLMK